MIVRIRLVFMLAAFAVANTSVADGAHRPWQLRCASMPLEQTAPAPLRSAARRFFPWIRPAAKALNDGPVFVVALSSRTAISRDGDARDSEDYYLHRMLIAVAPSEHGEVIVTGHRLGASRTRATLGFSTDGASRCSVKGLDVACGSPALSFSTTLNVSPRRGWRIVETELRIGRTGCFQLVASGPGLHATMPIAVPGPDYGTGGW